MFRVLEQFPAKARVTSIPPGRDSARSKEGSPQTPIPLRFFFLSTKKPTQKRAPAHDQANAKESSEPRITPKKKKKPKISNERSKHPKNPNREVGMHPCRMISHEVVSASHVQGTDSYGDLPPRRPVALDFEALCTADTSARLARRAKREERRKKKEGWPFVAVQECFVHHGTSKTTKAMETRLRPSRRNYPLPWRCRLQACGALRGKR